MDELIDQFCLVGYRRDWDISSSFFVETLTRDTKEKDLLKGGNKMLVLGRRPGEYVMIGDKIKVKVVKGKEGDLRLAIEAPKEFQIMRGELLENVENENMQFQ